MENGEYREFYPKVIELGGKGKSLAIIIPKEICDLENINPDSVLIVKVKVQK